MSGKYYCTSKICHKNESGIPGVGTPKPDIPYGRKSGQCPDCYYYMKWIDDKNLWTFKDRLGKVHKRSGEYKVKTDLERKKIKELRDRFPNEKNFKK